MLKRMLLGLSKLGVATDELPVGLLASINPPVVTSAPVIPSVVLGQGGSAASYSFGTNGLSNDPRLPYYMQNLTPDQLQTALNPDPSGNNALNTAIDAFNAEQASGATCDLTDCGNDVPDTTSPWLLVAIVGIAGLIIVEAVKR